MANSPIPFDASTLKKSAQEILAEPELFDSELDYFELGESYSLRRFKCAFGLTGGKIVWSVIGLLAAAGGLVGGHAWDSIFRGIASGLVTLSIAYAMFLLVNYLIFAPKQLDDTLRENL